MTSFETWPVIDVSNEASRQGPLWRPQRPLEAPVGRYPDIAPGQTRLQAGTADAKGACKLTVDPRAIASCPTVSRPACISATVISLSATTRPDDVLQLGHCSENWILPPLVLAECLVGGKLSMTTHEWRASLDGHSQSQENINTSIHAAVIDSRSPDCAELGRLLQLQGVAIVALESGDITDFWFTHLDMQWRTQPVSLCGMTELPVLFILERYAWDRGLRVIFCAEHHMPAASSVSHLITGPATTIQSVRREIGGPHWHQGIVNAFFRCVIDKSPPAALRAASETRLTARGAHEPLYSWFISPAKTPLIT